MFDTFKCGIFSKIKVQGVQNDQNCSYGLIAPKLPHLISHKIWVAAKFNNLNRNTEDNFRNVQNFTHNLHLTQKPIDFHPIRVGNTEPLLLTLALGLLQRRSSPGLRMHQSFVQPLSVPRTLSQSAKTMMLWSLKVDKSSRSTRFFSLA